MYCYHTLLDRVAALEFVVDLVFDLSLLHTELIDDSVPLLEDN